MPHNGCRLGRFPRVFELKFAFTVHKSVGEAQSSLLWHSRGSIAYVCPQLDRSVSSFVGAGAGVWFLAEKADRVPNHTNEEDAHNIEGTSGRSFLR